MLTLSAEHARAILLHATGFDRVWPAGDAGVVAVLDHLEWIQLDPIDRVGQNADLVVGARVDGVQRGDVHRVLRGRSFEHFAKERCIVHARHFPHYRSAALAPNSWTTSWWRNDERMARLEPALIAAVLEEVRESGPLPGEDLTDRGKAPPIDWGGWKGTSRLEMLAIQVLWARCEVVVSGRDARGRRLYDVPSRALAQAAGLPDPEESFAEAMILARVRGAGLLSRNAGPWWSMLNAARTDGTVDRLVAGGRLAQVRLGKGAFLTLPAFLDLDVAAVIRTCEPRSVVLGPLDPLLWDRALVLDAFGFDYIWEIYKPAAKRQWGYYVCPVLEGATLSGRLEARRHGEVLRVERRWGVDDRRWRAAIERLAAQNGCGSVDTSSCDRR